MDSEESGRGPVYGVLRVIGRAVATVLVVVWAILDELLFPLFRPLIAALSRLRIFETLAVLIARTPPYGVLVLLAVPFVVIEPLKVVALYWIATGWFVRGVLLLIGSYVLSIFTVDRIYHTGRGQLMKIGWFARLMTWIGGLRDRAYAWVRTTAAWQWAARMAAEIRGWVRGLFQTAR